MSSPADGGRDESRPRRARQEYQATRQGRRRRGLGRALGLTTLSALLPGVGLLATRRRRLGILIVVLAVLGLGIPLGYAVANGLTSTALQTAGDTGRLRVIAAVLVAGTVVWVGAVALTAILTSPRRTTGGQRAVLTVFTLLLCLAVSMPAAMALRYIDAHVDAVDKVFAGSGGNAGGGNSGATPTSVIGSDPDDPWADLPRVNVLMLGSDAAEEREGTRTDTMIVGSVDTRTGDSVLFSIPRNLQQVPIPHEHPLSNVWPEGYNCGNGCLINGIWTEAERVAEENPGWFSGDPDPGLTATREVIETILGLPIHHTVIVNLEGFEDLIDAMGGVVINVQEPIPIGGRTYTDAQGRLQLDPTSEPEWLEPGPQQLDGAQALGYSRSRVTSDDFSRMRRQRCMVAAVVDQVNPMTMLQRYPQIVAAVGDNVLTDVPVQDLDEWAELVLQMQGGTMRSLPFTASNTDTANPDYSDIRYRVYEALHATPAPPAPGADDDAGDDAAVTTSPEAPTPDPDVPDDDAAETSAPADELEEIGAVCD